MGERASNSTANGDRPLSALSTSRRDGNIDFRSPGTPRSDTTYRGHRIRGRLKYNAPRRPEFRRRASFPRLARRQRRRRAPAAPIGPSAEVCARGRHSHSSLLPLLREIADACAVTCRAQWRRSAAGTRTDTSPRYQHNCGPKRRFQQPYTDSACKMMTYR